MWAARSAALFSPVRWLLRRFGPQAGDGPSEKERENGWYEVTTVAKSDDGKLESRVVQKGKGDPVSFFPCLESKDPRQSWLMCTLNRVTSRLRS